MRMSDTSEKFSVSGTLEEDYFDDGGTAYGLTVDSFVETPDHDAYEIDLGITLRSGDEEAEAREDHWIHRLVGRRVRITVEVVDGAFETTMRNLS